MWLLVACTQFCSVLSVYLSKKLFDYVGSTNCCTVAGLQLATRWLILEILSLSGQMEQLPKRRDTLIRKLGFGTIFFAIAYAMSHTVGVASLYYNTLLFDQTTKIGTVPATLLLQSLVRGAQSPPFVWLALITTLSGCMLFFWSDSSSTFYGGTICLAGFVVRTYVDLWTVDSDGELIKPVTTMYCLGPPCALFLLVLAHFIDEDRNDVLSSPAAILMVIVGAAASLLGHLGMAKVIERSALPVAPIFLCVCKLFLFVFTDCVVFGFSSINANQAMGMLLSMVGLLSTIAPLLAFWLLLIGTVYVTVIAGDAFLSPFHFM